MASCVLLPTVAAPAIPSPLSGSVSIPLPSVNTSINFCCVALDIAAAFTSVGINIPIPPIVMMVVNAIIKQLVKLLNSLRDLIPPLCPRAT